MQKHGPITTKREDSSIVCYMILAAAVFFVFILNHIGGEGNGGKWFRSTRQSHSLLEDDRRGAVRTAVQSLRTLNHAISSGWQLSGGKYQDEGMELLQLAHELETYLFLTSGSSMVVSSSSSSFSSSSSSSMPRFIDNDKGKRTTSSSTSSSTRTTSKASELMHGAIQSSLPRLMQLEVDLQALPSRLLSRRRETASMVSSLVQGI